MKLILTFSLYLSFFVPVKTHASSTKQITTVCASFADGKIDAYKTLDALNINVDDYSIGVNNTAKIICL